MNKKINNKNQWERIKKAQVDLRKMEEEISPFIKKRKISMGSSTAGEWYLTSELDRL